MDAIGPRMNDLALGDAAFGTPSPRPASGAAGETPTPQELAELRKTAQDFEAVFLNNLLKAMRATVPENKLFNSGGATKFYQQMHDAEMAKALAGHGSGMGIAAMLIDQFSGAVERGAEAGAAPDGPAADGKLPPTRLGPPAPVALQRYRVAEEGLAASGNGSLAARLRSLAATADAAEADTLRRHGPALERAARQAGVDPRLVLAVVMEESGGDPSATSPKGAQGLMQLMPGTAGELGVERPYEPAANLQGGATYLARMLERFDGRLDAALAAYNAGPGNVDRAGGQVPDFPETRRYVERVMDRYRRLGGGTELDK
jgi:hypothetical protein